MQLEQILLFLFTVYESSQKAGFTYLFRQMHNIYLSLFRYV